MGLSRPTYAQIEKGERSPTIEELQCLARLYEMSLKDLLEGKRPGEAQIKIDYSKAKSDIRITIPKSSLEKAKQVLLYILDKVGAKPNVGETVLYKLLYFMDFDYYEKHQRPLLGLNYIKNHHGPTPVEFKTLVDSMELEQSLISVKSKYFQYDQRKYLPTVSPNLSMLSAEEKEHIDETLGRLSGKNATELSALSHMDLPWQVAEKGKKLEYEDVFRRSNDTSVHPIDDEVLWENAGLDETLLALGPMSDKEADYYDKL